MNYGLAVQNHASVTGTFTNSPGGKTPYQTGGVSQRPEHVHAPKVPYTNLYDPVTGAAVNGRARWRPWPSPMRPGSAFAGLKC